MPYCLYLRKSRSDIEAESRGESETLARHEKTLLDLARRQNYNITQIYREVVSGETIAARPVVQQLLREVESGMWDGVLVMEVERLARGDTIDQGIISQTFKYSDTKIVTPLKVYDPANEFDEEYFEFGLFMSRREYKAINRRLQRGRLAATKEGKRASGSKPYGYERIRCADGKGWTLRPIESEAEVVRLIFNLYTAENIGVEAIAVRLEKAGIPSPSGLATWYGGTVRKILCNPLYIGKIRWGERQTKRISENGKIKIKRVLVPVDQQTIVDGLHPAIIPEAVFQKAAELLDQGGVPPIKSSSILTNPLAGIIICAKCGRTMQCTHTASAANVNRLTFLRCPNRFCDNSAAQLSVVENRLLAALSDWLSDYRLAWTDTGSSVWTPRIKAAESLLKKSESDLTALRRQLSATHDLLEQGVYDTDTFLTRSRLLSDRIAAAESAAASTERDLLDLKTRQASQSSIIPKVETLLEVYATLPDASSKNDLLKEVLEKVLYLRTSRGHRNGPKDNFELTIFPRLPKR